VVDAIKLPVQVCPLTQLLAAVARGVGGEGGGKEGGVDMAPTSHEMGRGL